MDLLQRYPNALEQLEILKKDYLGVDNSVEECYISSITNGGQSNASRPRKTGTHRQDGRESLL